MKSREFGSDQVATIVFLHSSNTAGWMWGPQQPAFADHHLLVPDLPGFGENNDLEWVSVADSADRIAKLIGARAHGGRAHVVGLSLGSSVAALLAARHPDVVDSLVLASPAFAPPSAGARLSSRLMIALWNSRGFWRGMARSYGLNGEDAELFVDTGAGIRQETARRIFAEVLPGTDRAALVPIIAPTLAIAGGRDSAFVRDDSLTLIGEAIPDAVTAIAPGLHHHWNVEDPELFNDAVRAWVTGQTLSPGLDPTRSPTVH